jgi:hypothetical protein
MNMQTLGIVLANAVLILSAVWRLSGLLAELKAQLGQVIKDHEKDTATINNRLNAHEARIITIEQSRRRMN